jgi:hypothetical protein
MSIYGLPRPTHWVWRLIIANAVALLLLTALVPGLVPDLVFSPSLPDALRRPWTFGTYMLVLYSLGTRVEERMGSRPFILYYLYCGLGGALFSLGLAAIQPGAIAGASAAVLGVAVAYAMFWPDAELMVFPLPWPIRARTLVIALLVLDLAMALLAPGDGVAHVAHLGGAVFGYLFFRFQAFTGPSRMPRTRIVERAVMVQSGSRELERADTPVPRSRREPDRDRDDLAVETDRLLDKISGQGIASLTPAERKFLDEVSKRKRH